MAGLKADEEACCAFKLPPSLDTLTHLAAVEGLTLRDVITVALEIVIIRSFDESPDLPSGLADINDLKAATAPSFRAVLAAYRVGRAVQTADVSEVQVNSGIEVVDVGSSSLQFSKETSLENVELFLPHLPVCDSKSHGMNVLAATSRCCYRGRPVLSNCSWQGALLGSLAVYLALPRDILQRAYLRWLQAWR